MRSKMRSDNDRVLREEELCPDALLAGQEAAFARDIERLKARRAEFVTVPCPSCGAKDAKEIFQKYTFSYRSCKICRTLFMSPRPAPHLLAAYYADSENYRYWATHIFPATEATRRHKIHQPRLQQILSFSQRYGIPTGTLLEVGPGFGTFSALAMASGRFDRVVAIEPTPEMAAACQNQGIEVLPHPVEDLGTIRLAADIAVAFEVIEHLFDPHMFLQAMADQVSPGGLLVLSCPNGLGFDIATLGAHALAVDAEHINLFNPESLHRLVSACGFEVMEVSTPGRLDAEFVREAVLAGKFSLDGIPFLQRVLVDEWQRLGQCFQNFLADNELSSHMWMVARREET